MASTGWKNPGTAANLARSGGVTWNVVNDALTENAAVAYSGAISNWLRLTNFSLGIPAGAKIDGIEMRAKGSKGTDGEPDYLEWFYYITTGGEGDIGTVKTGVMTTTLAWATTMGTASDMWGKTLTAAAVNASSFGLMMYTSDGGYALAYAANIDVIQINVHYTPVSGNSLSWMGP